MVFLAVGEANSNLLWSKHKRLQKECLFFNGTTQSNMHIFGTFIQVMETFVGPAKFSNWGNTSHTYVVLKRTTRKAHLSNFMPISLILILCNRLWDIGSQISTHLVGSPKWFSKSIADYQTLYICIDLLHLISVIQILCWSLE